METVEIVGYKRPELTKQKSAELRMEGHVPSVLYGKSIEPIHFSAPAILFRPIVYSPNTYFVNLNIEGSEYKAICKEVQVHPVSEMLLHADFQLVTDDSPIKVEIPVKLVGRSVGVGKGGKIATKIRKVKVKGLPSDIPAQLEVNVSHLDLGKSVRVRDINPGSIEILNPGALPVATVEIPRALKSSQASAAATEK